MLIDTHCHLDFDVFDDDRDAVIQRAKDNGIKKIITISVNPTAFPSIKALTTQYENIYCSTGLHPCYVNEHSLSSDTFSEMAANDCVVGLGETGLDYYHDKGASKVLQQHYFNMHIDLAQQIQKPVIIHMRDAEEDTLAMLQERMQQKTFPALIHCFSASQQFADAVLDLGLYISLSGIVTFKNATALQEVASSIPLNRILVETDAPYLAPAPHRGKRNEPSFTKHTAKFLADLRGESFEEFAAATTFNAEQLFNL